MAKKSTNGGKHGISSKHALYVIIVLAACVGVLAFVKTQSYFSYLNDSLMYTAEVKRLGASLQLGTTDKNVTVGEQFMVYVHLNTNGEAIDGVDLYSLKYDPALLDVIDADTGQSGTQITSGGLLPIVVVNRVNEKDGLIQFAQVTNGGKIFKGRGMLATVMFKALKKGETSLSFDFAPGKTTDTNVAAYGTDTLRNAGTLKIQIN